LLGFLDDLEDWRSAITVAEHANANVYLFWPGVGVAERDKR